MKASLQGKDNVIQKLKMQISQFQETHSELDRPLDLRARDFQISQLTEKIIADLLAVYTKHLRELFEFAFGTCHKGLESKDKKALLNTLGKSKESKNSCTGIASGSQGLGGILKKHRDPASEKSAVFGGKVEEPPLGPIRSSSSLKLTGLSANACANQSEPTPTGGSIFQTLHPSSVFKCRNFVKKFIGTVRFGNDHFGAIMGYGDYVIGDSVISRVYYVEGLGHNLFSVGQFCDSDLEVAFRKHSCYVRDTDGVELLKGSRGSNLYTISIEDMMKSSPICLLSKASKNKSWLWHRRLNHLNFVHNKKPDLTFFRVFGALCSLTNDSENLGKLQPTADIGIFVGYAPNRKGYRIYNKRTRQIMETIHVTFDELTENMAPVQFSSGPAPMLLTPGPISSGLVPNPAPAIPFSTTTIKVLEMMLFQPMFDEYFNPPGIRQNPIAGHTYSRLRHRGRLIRLLQLSRTICKWIRPVDISEASSSGEFNIPESYAKSTHHHEMSGGNGLTLSY
ncbi:integrase, catalytic region, zinc finger, CCHC-type containing protein [Tanacetum coccineum]|uniref:Integrase, catalytic region, zinc finger, CCHC-type containing protein n=1 Tax=Tanacetum coccineum TaxID=301880 RepID=A0ABQ4WKA8_9ASTR